MQNRKSALAPLRGATSPEPSLAGLVSEQADRARARPLRFL